MLVVTVYKDDYVTIGNDIEVLVVRAGDKVKLGIKAPRGERIERVHRNKRFTETLEDGV